MKNCANQTIILKEIYKRMMYKLKSEKVKILRILTKKKINQKNRSIVHNK
jgi:hypothetical protein